MKLLLPNYDIRYQGEKIIGWAIHDGDLNVDHKIINQVTIFDVHSISDTGNLIEKLRKGEEELDQSICKKMEMKRNDAHVWLSFVTESGKLFDLDLSAFQFGSNLPFPCIVPIKQTKRSLLNQQKSFCRRDQLYGVNMQGLTSSADNLATIHMNSIKRNMPGKEKVRVEDFYNIFDMIGEKIPKLLENFHQRYENEETSNIDSTHYWDILKNL